MPVLVRTDIEALESPHRSVHFQYPVGRTTRTQMIAIGIGGVNESIFQMTFHPLINDAIAFMRCIFICILTPPFVEGPCVRKFVAECPWTCQVLRLQVFFFERGEISPVSILISECGDVGVGTHPGAGKKQGPLGVANKFRRFMSIAIHLK